MEPNQQFCLKWNNYHVNIASSFDSLRIDEDFVDVTVACDGFQTKAHKMVLSACSPYFRQLLKANPHPHPIVLLCDVSQQNMELLLDFMYHGEVNVAQEQLPEFLKVAEMLKVKGLADDKRDEPGASNGQSGRAATPSAGIGSPLPLGTVSDEPPSKRKRTFPPVPTSVPSRVPSTYPSVPPSFDPSAVKLELEDPDSKDFESSERAVGLEERLPGSVAAPVTSAGGPVPLTSRAEELGTGALLPADVTIEETEAESAESSRAGQQGIAGPSSLPYDSGQDPLTRLLMAMDHQSGTGVTFNSLTVTPAPPRTPDLMMLGNSDRRFPCFICGKDFGYPHHMRRHVETVHTMLPSQVICPECGRVYKNKNSLSVHMSMYHNSQRRAAQREHNLVLQAQQAQAQAQAQQQASMQAAMGWSGPPPQQLLEVDRPPWPGQ